MDNNNNINENNKNNDPLSTPFSGGKERYNSRTTKTDLKKNNRPSGNSVKPPNGGNLGRRGLPNLFNKGYRGNNGGVPKTNNNVNKAVNSLNSFSNRMACINNVFRRIGQANEDPQGALEDTVKDGVKNIVNKVPLNVKLIAVACICGFLFFLIIVASLFGVDSEDFEVDSDYSYTVGNTKYWWPIGSSETTGSGSVIMATGDPPWSRITSGVGYRNISNGSNRHAGIDIAGGWSNGVINAIAAIDGTVIEILDECHGSKYYYSKCPNPRGNYVKVKNIDGIEAYYQHLDSISVKLGDKLKQGQVLGKVGASGQGTGTHLHFELRLNGEVLNPVNYVDVNNPRPISEEAKLVNSKKITIPEDATNIQRVCLVFKAEGYPDEAIAGIIGNMQRESGIGIDSTAVNHIKCVGIVQWCASRRTDLMNAYGGSWRSLDNQINFVLQELNGMSSLKNYLMENHTPEEHADKFCNVYERPEAGECAKSYRRDYANGAYSFVQNGCE